MTTPRTAPQVLTRKEKQSEAYKLRLQGMTHKEIGQNLGVSTAVAFRMVDDETKRLAATRDESIKVQQQVVNDRLDFLIRQLWDRVEQGDVNAVAQVVKIEERRCKLLGLDEPQRIQATFDFEGLPEMELLSIAQRLGLNFMSKAARAELQAPAEDVFPALPGEVIHVPNTEPSGTVGVDPPAQCEPAPCGAPEQAGD